MTWNDGGVPDTTITREEFEGLVARASVGGSAALDELRQVLRNEPNIYRALGDVDRHVQDWLVEQIVGRSPIATECIRLRVADLRKQLEFGSVLPLERMLVEQCIATWLAYSLLQIRAARPHVRKTDAKHWDQRLDRAQRRHLAALKALADVQRARGNQCAT